jgi:hypothetical protein
MPILLWIVFPFAIWSACVPGIAVLSAVGDKARGLDATEEMGP